MRTEQEVKSEAKRALDDVIASEIAFSQRRTESEKLNYARNTLQNIVLIAEAYINMDETLKGEALEEIIALARHGGNYV